MSTFWSDNLRTTEATTTRKILKERFLTTHLLRSWWHISDVICVVRPKKNWFWPSQKSCCFVRTTASLRNTISIVESSGNVNVPVNNSPETVVANLFENDAIARPESRPTTVNSLPLQRHQQQIGGLHESSIHTDKSSIHADKSSIHADALKRLLPPVISNAAFRLGRWSTIEARIVSVLTDFSFRIRCLTILIFDLHCLRQDLRLKMQKILELSHASEVWIHLHAHNHYETIRRLMLLRWWFILIVLSMRSCTSTAIRWIFGVLFETSNHM